MRTGWLGIDTVDFRLLDALRREPLATHARLAQVIERSPSSVRRRLAALQDAGVLTGFVALPAPSLLGVEGVAATWATSAPTAGLLALPGTIMAGNSIRGGTLAGAYTPSADAWVEAASAIVGAPPTTRSDLDQYEGPVPGPLDLRVTRAMVEAPRGSAEELAERCGLSAKTVRKRRAALLEAGAVKVIPLVRTGATDDLLYHLHVTCEPEQRAAVLALLGEEFSASQDDDPILCAFVRPPSLAAQARTIAGIEALGVEKVEVIHEDEWEIQREALLAAVDAALAGWKRS
ncbi:MAG: winged helix-turn-helix transcriptional regulator [Thermoplasmatota archaeon]